VTLLVADKKTFYDSLAYTMVPEAYRSGYQAHRKLEPQLESKINDMKAVVAGLEEIRRTVDGMLLRIGTSHPDTSDFNRYGGRDDKEKDLIRRMKRRMGIYPDWAHYYQAEIVDILAKARWHLAHGLNLDDLEKDTCRGDADISPDKLGPVADPNIVAYHGTHVAGIIGAVRGNGIGMDGIADHVQIMMFKVNGTLRELRDSSLARAIVFAVDHGAKVLNLSFGKPYTWDKHAVDAAVRYAMAKDVLIVHAAGNSGDDLDQTSHYPCPVYADGGTAPAWIEVGASDQHGQPVDFSNYGKKAVDVFAPGVDIYSTLPYNQYASWGGTSMAAPVVAGLAALIREYYPGLTAKQAREIIIQSVVKRESLQEKCVSGGIVNAYNALKLAANYK
jgi:subtilisin family serine protease